jgi:formylglycine-generating enzyme required for sulfatase activity
MRRMEVTNKDFETFVKATGYLTVAEREPPPSFELPEDLRRPGAVVFVPPVPGDAVAPMSWWRYVPGANWRHPAGPTSTIEGRGSFPVVAIAYEDAVAYARWRGQALPSEAQWSWAAGHRQGAAAANTWQGPFPFVDTAEDGFTGLAPVGCFPPNEHGLHDMVGNAWELTSDAWDSVPDQHVIRGGSYLCSAEFCRADRPSGREPQEDGLAAAHVGFRTVLAPPPWP